MASILYISTRNILITVTFTTIYIFILDYLWNKNSKFCIFKKKMEKAYDYVEDMIMGDSDNEEEDGNESSDEEEE